MKNEEKRLRLEKRVQESYQAFQNTKTYDVTFDFDGKSIPQIISELQELQERYKDLEELHIENEDEYDYGDTKYTRAYLKYYRLENDEEYQKRLEAPKEEKSKKAIG